MRCPPQDVGTPMWWDTLAHDLGELAEELARTDVAGLAAQITTTRRSSRLQRSVSNWSTNRPSETSPASAERPPLDAYERDIGGD